MLPAPLPEPWWDLSGDEEAAAETRRSHDGELRREISDQPLAAREPRTAAKCSGCDYVLVALDRDEWALLHLTWSAAKERPGWPLVAALGSWDDVYGAAVEHAASH